MSFGEILSTGVVAGVVVQLLHFLREQYIDKMGKKSSAQHQGFRLSNELMRLSLECQTVLTKIDPQPAFGPEEKRFVPGLPDFDLLSEASDLVNLDFNDLARLADIEFRRLREEAHLSFLWREHRNLEDIEEMQIERLEFLQKEAHELAILVRRKHKLPEFGGIAEVHTHE